MGLPKSFLKQLKVEAVLYRANPVLDEWGNTVPNVPETLMCVLDATGHTYGDRTPWGEKEKNPHQTTTVYCDALGVKLDDRLTFPVEDGATVSDEVETRKVTRVTTYRDRKGLPLFQELTTETD